MFWGPFLDLLMHASGAENVAKSIFFPPEPFLPISRSPPQVDSYIWQYDHIMYDYHLSDFRQTFTKWGRNLKLRPHLPSRDFSGSSRSHCYIFSSSLRKPSLLMSILKSANARDFTSYYPYRYTGLHKVREPGTGFRDGIGIWLTA